MITKVRLNGLTLPVSNPQFERELQKVNTVRDDVVDTRDIVLPAGVINPSVQNGFLDVAVAAAFVRSGLFGEDKFNTLVELFQLSRRVDQFAAHAKVWQANGTPVIEDGGKSYLPLGTRSLQFDEKAYCRKTNADLPRHNDVDAEEQNALAADVHRIIHTLTGAEENDATRRVGRAEDRKDMWCGSYDALVGFRFNSYSLPAELKGAVERVAQTYLTSAQWLLQFDVTYCYDPSAHPSDRISTKRDLGEQPGLRYLYASAINDHATDIYNGDCAFGVAKF